MERNYSINFIEIPVSLKTYNEGQIAFQIYTFEKSKNLKYIIDPRYLIYDKFESKIRENSLADGERTIFFKRIDYEDRVELQYNTSEDFLNSLKYFKIAEFVPPYPGCEFCIWKKEGEELFFWCEVLEKNLTTEKKSCPYFKQKRLYKS